MKKEKLCIIFIILFLLITHHNQGFCEEVTITYLNGIEVDLCAIDVCSYSFSELVYVLKHISQG